MRNWNKWLEEDIIYLKENYPDKESKGCIKLHNKFTLAAIKYKAVKLGIKSNKWTHWDNTQDELLKNSWEYNTMKELLEKFSNRTYNQLVKRAQILGVKSKTNRARKGNLNFLNTLTITSCYWWGFIIADGYLSKRGDLKISLNIKDDIHLQKLANHLETTVKYSTNHNTDYCTISTGNKEFANKWLSILKIDKPKTYYPPNLSIFLTKDNLLPFFIGIIDGDGCIWESKKWISLRVELHGNWLNTLQLISNKLKEFYDIDCKIKTSNRGYAQLNINTKKDLKILKNYINNVEYLERKWDKLANL